MLDIKVPAVGESISEVTVSKYFKKEGDHVEMDEVIAEFESDKATFELNAPAAGVIIKLMASEGDTVAVGALICTIDTEAKASATSEKPAEPKAPAPVENKAEAKPE